MLHRQSYALRLLIDRRSMRERLMILLLIGAAVLLLAWAGLRLTGFDKHTVMLERIGRIQADVERYQATLSGLETTRDNPKIIALQNSNDDLQMQLDSLQDRIARIDESLMSPDRMVALLKELLDKQGQLALVSFQVQPVSVIESDGDGAQLFYQHGLKLELEGDFDALTAYLAKIEALPTQLFWDALTIQTESFPRMRIELIVHTLSQDKDWLNV